MSLKFLISNLVTRKNISSLLLKESASNYNKSAQKVGDVIGSVSSLTQGGYGRYYERRGTFGEWNAGK